MYLINGKGSIIRVIAGIFILGSVVLSLTVASGFIYFTGLVGLMLFLSGTTGFCPMEMLLKLTKIEIKKAVSENK